MGKNLKDIVDEGFSQLAVLAEKRLEILSRAEKIATAGSGPRGADSEWKMREAESEFLSEMNARVDQLLQELRQTLAQVADNNISFQSGLRDSLRLNVSGILAELAQTKPFLLNGARERLDLLLTELEKEFNTDKRIVSSEAARLLAELDNLGKSNQMAMQHTQNEIAAKLSLSEHETNAMLVKTFSQIVQDAERKRREVSDYLDGLYRRQVEKLESSSSELNSRISPLIREQCDIMKDSVNASTKGLNQIRDTAFSSANAELQEVSKNPLAELEKQSEDSHKELSGKLSQMRELSARLLKQEHETLQERNSGITAGADEIFTALSKLENGNAGTGRSRLDEAFSEISVELTGLADDLTVKLKDLLSAQSDGLTRLSFSTDKGFSDLCLDFKTQLADLIKAPPSCSQKEEELLLHLQKLEEQIVETYSMFRSSGFTGKSNGNGSGGGLKE